MSIVVKNVVKMVCAVVVLVASAFILAEISNWQIQSIGIFPPGIPTEVWLAEAVSAISPGSVWSGFWVTLICYFLWRLLWALWYRNNLVHAVNSVNAGFWIAILVFIVLHIVLLVIFFVQLDIMGWAGVIANFWVYFLPLVYTIPFAVCLIFFSKIGVSPFQRRDV